MTQDKQIIGQINKKSDFNVVLDDFNFFGPIDLLLHLIQSSKLDISLISISKITEPFLQYVKTIDMLDLERTADFIDVAATLLEMKSKAMLPRIEAFMPVDEDDSATRLLKRVEHYALMKDAAQTLKPLEEVGRFFKEPDLSCADVRVVLKDMTLEGLINAFKNLLLRSDTERKKPIKSIRLDRWTVAQQIDHIKEIVVQQREISFFELFSSDFTKSETINTFLALLELIKSQFVWVKQTQTYGDITIYLGEDMP